ncbi:syntaxin-41-like protein isoform X1 [Tanacetum coccineum]
MSSCLFRKVNQECFSRQHLKSKVVLKNVGTPTVGLPPAWVDVSELTQAHAKALMPSFGMRSLATNIQSLLVELRRKQGHYLKCLQQQQQKEACPNYLLIAKLDGVDLEMNYNGKHSKSEDDGFDGLVGESVNELAQIMKDLPVLDIDQGTIIDRIDYNIQNVAATTDEGLKQLQKGREKSETWGNDNVCYSTCDHVLRDVGSLLILLLFNIINVPDA